MFVLPVQKQKWCAVICKQLACGQSIVTVYRMFSFQHEIQKIRVKTLSPKHVHQRQSSHIVYVDGLNSESHFSLNLKMNHHGTEDALDFTYSVNIFTVHPTDYKESTQAH